MIGVLDIVRKDYRPRSHLPDGPLDGRRRHWHLGIKYSENWAGLAPIARLPRTAWMSNSNEIPVMLVQGERTLSSRGRRLPLGGQMKSSK